MNQNFILFAKSGPLGKVWIAATFEKGLNRAAVLNADIVKYVKLINKGAPSKEDEGHYQPLSIRISSLLYFGLVKIYSRKTKFLYEEIRDFQNRLTMSSQSSNIDLPLDISSNKVHTTLQDIPLAGVANLSFLLKPTIPPLFDQLAMPQLMDPENNEIIKIEPSYLGRITPQVYQSASTKLEDLPPVDTSDVNLTPTNLSLLSGIDFTSNPAQLAGLADALNTGPAAFADIADRLGTLSPAYLADLNLGGGVAGMLDNYDLITGVSIPEEGEGTAEAVAAAARAALQQAGMAEDEPIPYPRVLEDDADLPSSSLSSNRPSRRRHPAVDGEAEKEENGSQPSTPVPFTQPPGERLFELPAAATTGIAGVGERAKGKGGAGGGVMIRRRGLDGLLDQTIAFTDKEMRHMNETKNDTIRRSTPTVKMLADAQVETGSGIGPYSSTSSSTVTPAPFSLIDIKPSLFTISRAITPATSSTTSASITPSIPLQLSNPALFRLLLARGLRRPTPFVSDVGDSSDGHLRPPHASSRRPAPPTPASSSNTLTTPRVFPTPAVEAGAAAAGSGTTGRDGLQTPAVQGERGGDFVLDSVNREAGAFGVAGGVGMGEKGEIGVVGEIGGVLESPVIQPYIPPDMMPEETDTHSTLLSPLLNLASPDYVSAGAHAPPSMTTAGPVSSPPPFASVASADDKTHYIPARIPHVSEYDQKTVGLLNYSKRYFDQLVEKTGDDNATTTFLEYAHTSKRHTAAYAFMGLLTLQSGGYVKLHQKKAYAPIVIEQTDRLRTYNLRRSKTS